VCVADVVAVQGIVSVVESSPEVISRFFRHANYSPVECTIVVDLLTGSKYAKYESLPSDDVRETIVGMCRGGNRAFIEFIRWADAALVVCPTSTLVNVRGCDVCECRRPRKLPEFREGERQAEEARRGQHHVGLCWYVVKLHWRWCCRAVRVSVAGAFPVAPAVHDIMSRVLRRIVCVQPAWRRWAVWTC
jgi:hypothetical protein